jgi:hypothetical protein
MATRTAGATPNMATMCPVVDRYFAGFNAEDYRAVAALFEPNGVLLAPFEDPIVGSEAIYAYLTAEAVAMRATPMEVDISPADDGAQQVVVKGRVKTRLFSVNVRWTFVLLENALKSVEIKLLASLQELVQLDRG